MLLVTEIKLLVQKLIIKMSILVKHLIQPIYKLLINNRAIWIHKIIYQ